MNNRLIPEHKADEKCFACSPERDKGGRLVLKRSKFTANTFYLACSRAPDCKNTVSSKYVTENNYKLSTRAKIYKRLK